MQKNNKHTNRPYPRSGNAVIIYSRAESNPPKVGDRKMINGVMCVRRYAMTMHLGQRVQLMSRGKPVFEWVPEGEHKRDSSN